MVALREMREDEFPGYRAYFVREYAQELVNNYAHAHEHAIQLALAELEDSFPLGVSTSDNHLNCIDLVEHESTTTIGYLWYANPKSAATVFICDFYVFEKFRSKGYGEAAIKLLEDAMIEAGVDQIKLRVAYDNGRALSFYEDTGFKISGYNMAKTIK